MHISSKYVYLDNMLEYSREDGCSSSSASSRMGPLFKYCSETQASIRRGNKGVLIYIYLHLCKL